MDSRQLAKYIDHTILKPDATAAQVLKLCDEAKQYGFASVCVNPSRIALVAEALKGKDREAFARLLQKQTAENLRRVEDDLEWFTLKFDYRNADKPWNNSRDALERAITKLRSWCLGAEPDGKK